MRDLNWTRLWRVASIAGLVVRELIGWMLVCLGLYVFRISLVDYFNRALAVEGIVTAAMGVVLFRGGLQLVKVSVAARALRNKEAPQVA